jgi:hypothetical protein
MDSRRRTKVLLIAIVASAVAFLPGPASGRDAKDQSLSPTQPTFNELYPALVASSPAPGTVGSASHSPKECKTAQYCDTIDLTFAVPRDYEYTWSIRLTVTWTASAATHDMDVYLYDINEGLVQSAATGGKPEVILKGDLDPGLHYLVIVNFVGPPNDPYRVIGDFIQGKKIEKTKKPESPFRVIEQGGDSPSSGGGSPGFAAGTAPSGAELQGVGGAPVFDPIRVDTPEGLALSAGRRAPRLSEGGARGSDLKLDGGRMLTGAGLLALLGGLSYALFFAPRRRPGTVKTLPA